MLERWPCTVRRIDPEPNDAVAAAGQVGDEWVVRVDGETRLRVE
jgi:hypothetical protein